MLWARGGWCGAYILTQTAKVGRRNLGCSVCCLGLVSLLYEAVPYILNQTGKVRWRAGDARCKPRDVCGYRGALICFYEWHPHPDWPGAVVGWRCALCGNGGSTGA